MELYKFTGGFGRKYNEIYDVINKMRNNKIFDYSCSDKENDKEYLDLNCEQAKILKYILK